MMPVEAGPDMCGRPVCFLILVCLPAFAGDTQAQTLAACERAPEVRKALGDLPDVRDFRIPFEERMKPLRELLEKHPGSVFVHHRYQDAFRRSPHLYWEFDRAFDLYRSKPDDPLFRYLDARLTASFDPQKAEEILNDLIVQVPAFPWPHLALVELTDRPNARDPEKAARHLRAFLDACPSSLDGYALLRSVDDPEMIREGARKMRSLLEPMRDDPARLEYWRILWDLEFRAATEGEQEQVRRRVLDDVRAIKKVNAPPTVNWYWLFRSAVQLTGDDSIREWMEHTVMERFPASTLAVTVERERWARSNPPPDRAAGEDAWKQYNLREHAAIREWHKRWPDDPSLAWELWHRPFLRDEPPDREELRIIDTYRSMIRSSPDYSASYPPESTLLAECYVKWGMRLDQVPGLIDQGMREIEGRERYRPRASMFPEEVRGRIVSHVPTTRDRSGLILADLYLRTGQIDDARDVIEQGVTALDEAPIGAPDDMTAERTRQHRRHEWTLRQARLAELEGKTDDALSLYQKYLAPVPREVLIDDTPMKRQADAIKKLYLSNGGTEEGWLAWAGAGSKEESALPASRPVEFTRLLDDFETKDLSGKTWRLADLKGKATLIDVWATWCGPCRAEHPELQKLYEKIKDRSDILLLTFSTDDHVYGVASYMKTNNYTFPVIVSRTLTDRLFPYTGLPSRWIINPEGRRSSRFRFRGLEPTLAELERVAVAEGVSGKK